MIVYKRIDAFSLKMQANELVEYFKQLNDNSSNDNFIENIDDINEDQCIKPRNKPKIK